MNGNGFRYVGQEPVLFSGSIADNIAYGIDREVMGSQYDDGNIRAAVERAGKHLVLIIS